MEMGEDHILDRVTTLTGILQVLLDITLWIDDRSLLRLFIRNHVGGVR